MINNPFLLLLMLLLLWLQNVHGTALWTDEELRSFEQSVKISRNKKMVENIIYYIHFSYENLIPIRFLAVWDRLHCLLWSQSILCELPSLGRAERENIQGPIS